MLGDSPSCRQWQAAFLLIGLALLFGVAAAAQRRRQIIEDSPAFANALQSVKPLFTAINVTPRAIKRFQNRMRYLAARLRPVGYDPDGIDSVLHWLGLRFRRSLVPTVWFEDQPRQAIDEPALIVLGAIEAVAPNAFANPAELFTILDNASPRDWFSEKLAVAWSQVRASFSEKGLAMPTVAEFARYATFVQSKTREAQPHVADVVPFHRDPTSGPRLA